MTEQVCFLLSYVGLAYLVWFSWGFRARKYPLPVDGEVSLIVDGQS